MNPAIPGPLLITLHHPNGSYKTVRLGVADDVPSLSHAVRTSAHVFIGYAREGWVVEAVHGVYYDPHGRSQMRPLEALLVVMAEVVGPHHVLRPVETSGDAGRVRK